MLHRTIITDQLTGARFNDYDTVIPDVLLGVETDDTKFDYVTQVCEDHVKQYGIADGLYRGVGSGQCGVVGCDNDADHVYLFMIEGPPLEEPMEEPESPKVITQAMRPPVTRPPAPTPPSTIQGTT
jgi:hypothetical protein